MSGQRPEAVLTGAALVGAAVALATCTVASATSPPSPDLAGPSSRIDPCAHAGPLATGHPPPGAPVASEAASVPAVGGTTELTVFAAASLRDAFETIASRYLTQTGVSLALAFDASSTLRAQIEQGAPVDVFAAADTLQPSALVESGLAHDAVTFACDELAIVVPSANPAGISSASDLGRPGVRIVAAAEGVPITAYAQRLVQALGIAEGYATNVVSREDNVAAVRAKIELGEGDAAIVYATDALAAADRLRRIPVPSDLNVPATFAAVIVDGTDQPDASRAFLAWLVGPDGQGTLARFGFEPAPWRPAFARP